MKKIQIKRKLSFIFIKYTEEKIVIESLSKKGAKIKLNTRTKIPLNISVIT